MRARDYVDVRKKTLLQLHAVEVDARHHLVTGIQPALRQRAHNWQTSLKEWTTAGTFSLSLAAATSYYTGGGNHTLNETEDTRTNVRAHFPRYIEACSATLETLEDLRLDFRDLRRSETSRGSRLGMW